MRKTLLSTKKGKTKGNMDVGQIIDNIIRVHEQIEGFWNEGAYGWAPKEAAHLLAKSRLDRQTSLAHCLHMWTETPSKEQAEGVLVLAWANLGALVEGTMKWFLCVYNHNYKTNPLLRKDKTSIEPDELFFKKMADFFRENIWNEDEASRRHTFVEKVREQRNVIHAYQDRQLGNLDKFYKALAEYQDFLISLDSRVPYP